MEGVLIGGAIGLALAVALLYTIADKTRAKPPEPESPYAETTKALDANLEAFRAQVAGYREEDDARGWRGHTADRVIVDETHDWDGRPDKIPPAV